MLNEMRRPAGNGDKELVDAMGGRLPGGADAAKLDHWRQELIDGRSTPHPTRKKLARWVVRGFFILLGVALLAFVIIFPFVAFR